MQSLITGIAIIDSDIKLNRITTDPTVKYEEDSFIKEMSTKYFPDYDDDEGKRLAKFLISCIEGNIN